MSIAQNIRYLRRKQGWGQDTLAEKLGYKSYTTIQKWESGVSEPPLKVVRALAELFGVDINDFASADLENSEKNIAAPQGDDLTPLEVELMNYVRALSEEQKCFLLAQMQTLKEQGSAAAGSQ